MYHPTLGRFLQRDPIGYPDGMNSYAAYHVMGSQNDPSGTAVSPPGTVSPPGNRTDFYVLGYNVAFRQNVQLSDGTVGEIGAATDASRINSYSFPSGYQERDGMLIGYKGNNCSQCCFVQFISSYVKLYDKGVFKGLMKGMRFSSPSDTVLTTDAKNPRWYIDSASENKSACYSSLGLSIRTKNLLVIYDRPDPFADIVQYRKEMQQNDQALAVNRFVTYLVCAGKVEYRIEWVSHSTWVKWDPAWSKSIGISLLLDGFVSSYKNEFVSGQQVNALDAQHKNMIKHNGRYIQ